MIESTVAETISYSGTGENERDLLDCLLQATLENLNCAHGEIPETLVVVTDDIVASNREYCHPNEYAPAGVIENLNGRMILPNPTTGSFVIILKKKLFDTGTVTSTVPHEWTHVVDYSSFIAENDNPYEMTGVKRDESNFSAFYLWSEFNATRTGMLVHHIWKWHETFGPDLPANIEYSFDITFGKCPIGDVISMLDNVTDEDREDAFWRVLEEVSAHLGLISVYSDVENFWNTFGRFEGYSQTKTDAVFGADYLRSLFSLCYECTCYRQVVDNLPRITGILHEIELNVRHSCQW